MGSTMDKALILIRKYLEKNKIKDTSILETKIPLQKEYGDLTTNISLKIAKQLKKSPMVIAKEIKTILEKEDYVSKVEVKPPGFINIYFNSGNKNEIINKILKEKNDFGKLDYGKGKKINIEFISANPTGHLHIGHARNGILGDIVANLYEWTGHEVYREYWINDYGNQMVVLANAIFQFYQLELDPKYTIAEDTAYQGKDIQNASKELVKEIGDKFKGKKLEGEIQEFLSEWGGEYFLKEIKKIIKAIGIKKFDLWQSEKGMFDSGKVKASIEKLQTIKGATYEEDGALWLNTTANSEDDKNRVLEKSDKTFTYIVGDIANHVEKYSKNFDTYINVWGSDHAGYDQRVRSSIEWMGNDSSKLIVDFIQMVKLVKDGKEFKMSKRQGTVVTIKELLDNFGKNKLRYFISSKHFKSQFDLDVSLLEDDSNNSLLNYSMYSYVRAKKIISELGKDIKRKDSSHEYNLLTNSQENELIKSLSKMEHVIERASRNREPQMLIVYLNEISKKFHSFYGNSKIKGEEENLASERFSLVEAYLYAITNLYAIIGIEPIKEM